MLNFTTQRNVNQYHTDIIIQVRQGYNQTDLYSYEFDVEKVEVPNHYQCKNYATILKKFSSSSKY